MDNRLGSEQRRTCIGGAALTLPVAVLISGRGTNLQAIIDAISKDGLPVEICGVISDRPDAVGLCLAKQAGIDSHVVDSKTFSDRNSFDTALMERIDECGAEFVLLAGFMRILTPAFITHYAGRILNIHPSLLPSYPGLRTHQRAIEDNVKEHGASVHFVTEELDGGPVIVQTRIPVVPGDDAGQLAARVLAEEHRIYPLAIRWLAEGRVKLDKQGIVMDGKPLHKPVLVESETADKKL